MRAYASTYIPETKIPCAFSVEPCEDSDTLYQVKARFRNTKSPTSYYQLFSRVGTGTRQYLASYLGTLDGSLLDNETVVTVYKGHQLGSKYRAYYMLQDTVSVKFAHIDETSFHVWDSYLKTLSLSTNAFFPITSGMFSNIHSGYGYWCGMNSVEDHIVIRDSIR